MSSFYYSLSLGVISDANGMLNVELMAEILECLGGISRSIVSFDLLRFSHNSKTLEDMSYNVFRGFPAVKGGEDEPTVGVDSNMGIFEVTKFRDVGDVHLPNLVRE